MGFTSVAAAGANRLPNYLFWWNRYQDQLLATILKLCLSGLRALNSQPDALSHRARVVPASEEASQAM